MTRKHVPALVSIIANSSTKIVQTTKFYFGDYVQIAKTYLPPTYSLNYAETEETNEMFYEKELNLIGIKADFDKNGQC